MKGTQEACAQKDKLSPGASSQGGQNARKLGKKKGLWQARKRPKPFANISRSCAISSSGGRRGRKGKKVLTVNKKGNGVPQPSFGEVVDGTPGKARGGAGNVWERESPSGSGITRPADRNMGSKSKRGKPKEDMVGRKEYLRGEGKRARSTIGSSSTLKELFHCQLKNRTVQGGGLWGD